LLALVAMLACFDDRLIATTQTIKTPMPKKNWLKADPYVQAHLAEHAAAAGKQDQLDELLADRLFLVSAESLGLLRVLHHATSEEAREAARVYQLVSHHMREESSGERAVYLEMAARQQGADKFADDVVGLRLQQPWNLAWAHWQAASLHRVIGKHDGDVSAVALAQVEGRPVIVSGGSDGTVRVWDLASGEPRYEPLTGHDSGVTAVAVGQLDGRPVIVSGGWDGTVRVWDLASGEPRYEPLTGHDSGVTCDGASQEAKKGRRGRNNRAGSMALLRP